MIDEIVQKYIELRDLKAQMKAEYENRVAPIQAALDKAEAHLLGQMQTLGVSSVKTGAGTAYTSQRTSATVADWDSVLPFVREGGLWHLLEKRVNKTAVDEYVAQHGGLPPGVNYRTEITVGVRRA